MEEGLNKRFTIEARRTDTSVMVGLGLGRILQRPEVAEIVRGYGSTVERSPANTIIEIVPPIPAEHLDKFGNALVNLAHSLDPSPPMANYKVNKVE